jgi:streptogramin lyase
VSIDSGPAKRKALSARHNPRGWFCHLLAAVSLAIPGAGRAQTVVTAYSCGDCFLNGIVAGPDGNLWITQSGGKSLVTYPPAIDRITPAGTMTSYPLDSGSIPWGIAPGADGNLWFTDYALSMIGRITPEGAITEYPVPTQNSGPSAICSGPDGNLWLLELGANQAARVTPAGIVTEFPIPAPNGQTPSITAGADGNLWFTESVGRIGRITPTGMVTEFPLPTPESLPLQITAGQDGNLWFTEDSPDTVPNTPVHFLNIARMTPSGVISEFTTPGLADWGYTHGIARGPDGNIWFGATTSSTGVGRIKPSGEITVFMPSLPIGSTALTVASGPDGNLWFTSWTPSVFGCPECCCVPSYAGYLQLSSCLPDANTLCLDGARFIVQAQWTDFQGNTGPGNVVPNVSSSDSGLFWFFGPDNWEMLLKVLNGCAVNDHYWFFGAASTDVGYTIQVTDTQTGDVKTYTNPLGTTSPAIIDTAAFGSCP